MQVLALVSRGLVIVPHWASSLVYLRRLSYILSPGSRYDHDRMMSWYTAGPYKTVIGVALNVLGKVWQVMWCWCWLFAKRTPWLLHCLI